MDRSNSTSTLLILPLLVEDQLKRKGSTAHSRHRSVKGFLLLAGVGDEQKHVSFCYGCFWQVPVDALKTSKSSSWLDSGLMVSKRIPYQEARIVGKFVRSCSSRPPYLFFHPEVGTLDNTVAKLWVFVTFLCFSSLFILFGKSLGSKRWRGMAR